MKDEFNDIGNLFKDSFEGYATSPSSAVWNSIKHKLWLKGFLAFSVNSFNVYYATLLIATITFTGISVLTKNTQDNSKCNEKVVFNENTQQDSMYWLAYKKNYYRLPEGKLNTKNIKLNTRNKQVKNNNSANENSISKAEPKSNDYPVSNKNSKVNLNTTEINKTKNKELKKSTENKLEKIFKEDKINNSKTNKALITNSRTDNSLTLPETKSSYDNNEILENISNTIQNNNTLPESKLNNVNKTVYDTIIVTVNDTVLYVDTIEVYDTIRYEEPVKKHQKRKIKRNLFEGLSVDIFTGIENTSYNYISNVDTIGTLFLNSSTPAISYSMGANVGYEIDKWKIQTGVSYMQLNENFNYTEEINTIDTTGSFWEYTPVGYTHSFDTVGYQFQIDTLNGDTFFVYVPMIIDSIIMVFDSSKVYQTETNNSIKNINLRNKYTYLNIPVMFGYSFYNTKKLTLTGKLGGNIGILLNAKGKSFSLTDNKSIIDFNENTLPFIKTNISWIASLNMYYKLEKNMGIYIEPYFRGSLNSMFDSNHPVGLKANAIGLYAGFRFYL